ncbi:Stp1/IreP family PP2C-type Ser/Thr phosphatase [Paenibacillus beijingensis]|uniref:Serine/threonine protein phosphatase n=1 Tax=Paenibacillus beijingensis TaxID=1126833 RepID=A0A0D5NMF9_9BACL|nr:Stp1/IreP family PP2C-type Ser/Thr phosphatase [Paenibacillus beijingensis]AJY76461.1 serine/threonine protein phosphatase [Paenibacillus beijingensis]
MITANRSDIGRIRLANEDRSWVGTTRSGLTLAIVADGMGGHQAGDVASQLAVEAFRDAMEDIKVDLTADEAKMLIRQAILQANEVVFDMASRNEQYHNMGTTIVTALFLQGSSTVIGHIGDSRAYRVSGGQITQLTEDHTLVNELLRSGQISASEAVNHPRRNVLTRALGTDQQVDVDVQVIKWNDEDTLLLCSDGLSGMVGDDQMLETLLAPDLSLEEKAERLIQLALQAGGDDNITVVLLQAGMEREGVKDSL